MAPVDFAPQYGANAARETAALVGTDNQEADMNKGYRFKRHHARHESRWPELVRFLGSLLGIWAACATGIYLIGPSEQEAAAEAVAAAQPLAVHLPVVIAGYSQ